MQSRHTPPRAALQFYGDDVTVADIKRKLAALEGVPAGQLALVHAGRALDDNTLLADYGLADFNRAGEAFIDLQARSAHGAVTEAQKPT